MSEPLRTLLFLIVLISILSQIPITRAGEPDWNYSQPDGGIGGLAVSPKGDLIVAGAGKVLFFSRNGTLLAQEPFGSDVRITADGKYTASVYSSTIYYFENPLPAGSPGRQKATKLWDFELSEQINSFDMNRDGSLIAGQTLVRNLFVLNTKTRVGQGNTKVADSVIKISGGGIIGISAGKIHTYSSTGTLSHTEDITSNSAPRFLLISSGSSVVFSDGQAIRRVNSYNGTEYWKQPVSGAVSALSITPGGSLIVAGTETGNIAGLDANGNFLWTYSSNPENRQSEGITCSAVSDQGETVAAGTSDGKILFLDSRGELTGSYAAPEYIRHIATSADGSVIAAASNEELYVFSPSSFPAVPVSIPTRSGTINNTMIPSTTRITVSIPSPQATTPASPTEVPPTSSVIRTATQSPPALVTLLLSLALAIVIAGRKR